MAMPTDAQSVYATLLHRTKTSFLPHKLELPVDNLKDIESALDTHGLIWVNAPLLSTRLRLSLLTKEELVELGTLNENPLKSAWKKSKLIHSLSLKCKRETLPDVWTLRHQDLFRWIFSSYLNNHTGDISLMTRSAIGQLRTVGVLSTVAKGVHANRRQRRQYLSARKWNALPPEERIEKASEIRDNFDRSEIPPDWRHRFSSFRYSLKALKSTASTLLQKRRKTQALADFQRILNRISDPEAALKMTRALELSGRHVEAFDMCQHHANHADVMWRYQFQRSGRRLKKKAKGRWIPLPPLPEPKTRALRLLPSPSSGIRPEYTVENQSHTVENAVLACLRQHGRKAIFTESVLWKSLFATLFLDEIFLPIDCMLPSKFMKAPLDFHSPLFYQRREKELNEKLNNIRNGQALDIIQKQGIESGLRVDGLRLDLVNKETLMETVNAISADALSDIMTHLLKNPGQSGKGMPDLFVFPGTPCTVEALFPRQLPAHAMAVELKTPSDTLSDAQCIWLNRLKQAGVAAELWNVKANPETAKKDQPG